MISLYKLEKLPRTQRLRKIAKTIFEAEIQCKNFFLNREKNTEPENSAITGDKSISNKCWNTETMLFFAGITKLLQQDTLFPPAAVKAISEANVAFKKAAEQAEENDPVQEYPAIRRALNTVRHILLAETGHSQADWDFIDSGGKLDWARRRLFPGMMVFLEDIRSPYNVGSMFRTAESFGVERIFLSSLCADPLHPRSERSAMGCVDILPWERLEPFGSQETSEQKASLDVPLFALETGGIPLPEFPFPKQGLLIAGSEELGVSPKALSAADVSLGRVSIPCYGVKGSLNVSVAFGIVMQAWACALSGA